MVRFIDGSGNSYKILEANEPDQYTLSYEPVEPAMSSSGIYSGENAWQTELTHEEYQKVAGNIRELARKQELHTENRVKGSGLFILAGNDGKPLRWIMKPGLPEMEQFIKLLESLKP